MTKAENDFAGLVTQAVDQLWNKGELDIADRLFAPNFVNHGGLIPELAPGPEAVKLSVLVHRLAFPALHITVESLVTEGQLVELRWSARNIRADDNHASVNEGMGAGVEGVTFGRFAGQQIEESWTYWNEGSPRQLLAS